MRPVFSGRPEILSCKAMSFASSESLRAAVSYGGFEGDVFEESWPVFFRAMEGFFLHEAITKIKTKIARAYSFMVFSTIRF